MAKTKEGFEIINLKDKKVIYATKEAPHHKAGDKISCHPLVAEFMIMNGWAVEKGKTEKAAKAE